MEKDTEVTTKVEKTWRDKLSDHWYILLILPLAAFLISFPLGKYSISIPEMLRTIFYHFVNPDMITNPNLEATIFNIRLPRLCAALLIGGGLSISGASYQGMFKNPMVSPDILGATSGASLCACIAMLMHVPNVIVQIVSFLGGLGAVLLANGVTKKLSRDPILSLVLAGMMVSALCQAGTSLVKLVADPDNELPQITFWLMGGLNRITIQRLQSLLIPMAIGFVILFYLRWHLNVLSFGDEEARSMGIKTTRTRNLLIFASTLITSSAVSVSGMIGWVGLIIPHVGRALVGSNFRRLIPASAVLGAAFLILVDDVARCAFTIEVPIGILTAFLGVPFFYFIFRYRTARGRDDA